MSWSRPVSGTERAWVVADQVYGAFCNQMVLEGDAAWDREALEAAVVEAAAVNPGARVVLRGAMCRARWVDTGQAPPVTVVDGTGWDGWGPEGAPFLRRPLDAVSGPTTEVLLVRGTPPRVIFRTAHATMDGGGTIAFAHDVFRVLRGEAPVGNADPVTDLDLAKPMVDEAATLVPEDALAATGLPAPGEDGVTWRRLRVPGTPRGILGRAAKVIADQARSHGDGVVRIQVPADLRRQHPEVHATANLTGIVDLEVDVPLAPRGFQQRVREVVAEGAHARAVRFTGRLRHVPLWLARGVTRKSLERIAQTGRYGATAVLSNLGRLDFDALSGGGWTTTAVWFVPPGTPVTSCFAGFSGSDAGVDVTVTVPRALATDGRLDGLMTALREELSG